MKLIELQGYKEHPAYQAVKSLDQSPKKVWDRTTSYNPVSMKTIEDELGKLGWAVAGNGFFATVFIHPSKDYVLKIFYKDSGYKVYAKIIAAYQHNPHVPQLRGKLHMLAKDVYVIRMERLQPLSREHDPILKQYTPPYPSDSSSYGWRFGGKAGPCVEDVFSDDNREFLADHWPDLYDLMNVISSKAPAWDDMHSLNVMKRGKILVVTDPLATLD
jgi:hypothetical protein